MTPPTVNVKDTDERLLHCIYGNAGKWNVTPKASFAANESLAANTFQTDETHNTFLLHITNFKIFNKFMNLQTILSDAARLFLWCIAC